MSRSARTATTVALAAVLIVLPAAVTAEAQPAHRTVSPSVAGDLAGQLGAWAKQLWQLFTAERPAREPDARRPAVERWRQALDGHPPASSAPVPGPGREVGGKAGPSSDPDG